MSARGPTLAALLGSQVEAFHTQLHANDKKDATSGAENGKAKKARAAAGAATVVLSTPFTHTVRQPSLLSSLLTAAVPSAAPALVTAIDAAHALLAKLLPKEVNDTPAAADFHALFMQYLDACAGAGAGAGAAANDDKKKKRKREEAETEVVSTSSTTSSRSIHRALHTVSTTVIGRLAARCITLLSRDERDISDEFDAALLESPDSYWSVLSVLLRSDSLSARFTPSLFPLLTRHAALPMIESALVHLHDASERDLVEVAKYALDHLPPPELSERHPTLALDLLGEETTRKAETQTKKKRKKSARAMVHTANAMREPIKVVEVPGGSFAVILDLLLTSPVSANFLRHSLSALAPSHAHKLLLYLYAWTLRYWFHTESEVHQALHDISKEAKAAANGDAATAAAAKPRSQFRIPSFSQVIDWMNILLDAIDFMRVYQKESRADDAAADATDADAAALTLYDLVSSLASHISHHHLQFLDRSQDLKGFIAIFAQMKRHPNAMPLPQAPMMDYNVEIIELGA